MMWRTLATAAVTACVWSLPIAPASAVEYQDFCADGSVPVHVFMVDQTEVFDSVDRRRLENGINALFDTLEPGERLDIYPLTDRPGSLNPLVQMCVPGCPEEMDDEATNWSFVCDRISVQRAKRSFRNRFLEAVVLLAGNRSGADGTEIVRSLQQLAYEYDEGEVARLSIFSDMLEFSDLNRRINGFGEEESRRLLARSIELFENARGLAGADVVAFGFGKRLGQQALIDEKTLEYQQEGRSESDARQLAEAATVLPNAPRNAIREFWRRFFEEAVGAESQRLTQNY
jgi:hypothetical protein